MAFANLPLELGVDGIARIKRGEESPFDYTRSRLDVSERTLVDMARPNTSRRSEPSEPLARVGGRLAFHCTVNLDSRRVVEAAARATAFRGYEAILPGRDLREIGLVSSTAAGICGGVHTTASALCLEMALGIEPPPLGIVMRNLLLSCQYLNDNPMHLFNLSGPDYSEAVIRRSNPEILARAQSTPTRYRSRHGYATVSEILVDLNRPDGQLYLEALQMVRIAREAYALLGGKYPHSESIVPGGVTVRPTLESLDGFIAKLGPFCDYTKRCIAVWDEVFDFLYEADARFLEVGAAPATLVDFGQWDHEQAYDGSYRNCNAWGEQRWSTPGAVVDGRLMTTRLTDLNIGIEEFVDRSYYEPWQGHRFRTDPLGNPLGPHHPWNKTTLPQPQDATGQRYSWYSSLTWDRHVFEVGAYARMYVSALARKLPPSRYVASTGHSLQFNLAADELPAMMLEWTIPSHWNAIERNRARAYAVGFNLMVTLENCDRARRLLSRGETVAFTPFSVAGEGTRLGVGFWGAGRGLLAHWAVVEDGVLSNYQISTPSRINASPRTPWGALGACEQAITNTPIIENQFDSMEDFQGIDILRAIQSFDPCMPCSSHLRFDHSDHVLDREVTTTCSL